MGFLIRWVVAFALLALTYNPTPFNYIRWATENWQGNVPIVVLLGLVLIILYIVFMTAILRGIGVLGVVLILAVLAALIWVLASYGVLTLENPGLNTWIAVLALSLVLAVGMYWGILWKRISGQVEVDDEGAK